jgi:hypothetical protein
MSHSDKVTRASDHGASFVILIPLFNDWAAAEVLLPRLLATMRRAELRPRILLVDDGSTQPRPDDFLAQAPEIAAAVHVLPLRRNLGHQRAIAIGLCFLAEHGTDEAVVVRDGDGEDSPDDVVRLWEKHREIRTGQVVFADRRRRSENLRFRLFYKLYRLAHYLLTGYLVRVGNFSLIPFSALQRLVVVSELWNHYAAAVYKARLPHIAIPTKRAPRLAGESKMNFVGLVTHGLSAMSVHSEIIGTRALAGLCGVGVLTALALAAVLVVRFGTSLAIPGWATVAVGLLVIVFMQAMMMALVFVFVVLGNRQASSFLPLRDYKYFVNEVYSLGPDIR